MCDEVKNMKKDFRCSQKLLVTKMGYFAEVTTGSRLDNISGCSLVASFCICVCVCVCVCARVYMRTQYILSNEKYNTLMNVSGQFLNSSTLFVKHVCACFIAYSVFLNNIWHGCQNTGIWL